MRMKLLFAALLLTFGCGKKSTTVMASCNRPAKLCTDYYVQVEAVIRSSCEDSHGGTWADGKACDRTGAVAGCQTTDSVQWWFKGPGETEQSVKESLAKLCTPSKGDEGIVPTTWQRKP